MRQAMGLIEAKLRAMRVYAVDDKRDDIGVQSRLCDPTQHLCCQFLCTPCERPSVARNAAA